MCFGRIVLFFVVTLLLVQPSSALPPEEGPEFEVYLKFLNNGDEQAAIERLNAIIAENPGSQQAAFARLLKTLQLASSETVVETTEALEQLEAEFPTSRIAILARASLNDLEFGYDDTGWRNATNALLASSSFPSIEEMVDGTAQRVPLESGLSSEDHHLLVNGLVARVSTRLSLAERINVMTFLALNYPNTVEGGRVSRGIAMDVRTLVRPDETFYQNSAPETVPPVLVLDSVLKEEVESPVTITIRAHDGPLESMQMDLTTAEFIVDGVKIEQIFGKSLAVNGRWEALISFTEEFSPGSHSGVFRLSDTGGSQSELPFSFVVLNDTRPAELIVPATKDSTLQHRNPHQNEGASPYLTLEKIQGKATRSAVAFDLTDVNLTGLTSATLRLTVDPSQGVNGWGNGDTISALPLSTGWVEGNGQSFGLKKKDQVAGSGSGVTWFSPVDSDISNDYANSTVQWNGGTTGTPTSPLIVMQNHYTGTVDFDVTNDLLNVQGQNGWLIKKDQENRGSKVTFYSREGAAAAGNTDLAPTLILNYGNSTASKNSPGSNLLARLGWNSGPSNLKPTNPSSELKNLKQALKDSSTAAFVGDQFLQNATRANPPLHVATAIAYRVWLG